MKTNALLIFTRNPELGKVKTRLAKAIGDENALIVYNDLLLHTLTETKPINCDKFVFYDTTIIEDDIWPTTFYQKKMQSNGDLGERMHNAFKSLFEMGYQHCMIVGSDLLELKTSIIETAFKKMFTYDAVIGPAEDGGYYLLGLKTNNSFIFQNKDWGTNTVLKATMNDLKNEQIGVLDILNDIDTFEDLQRSSYDMAKLNIV